MKYLTQAVLVVLFIVTWIMGTVIAFEMSTFKGIVSIVTGPFYSWYLLIKHVMFVYDVLHLTELCSGVCE